MASQLLQCSICPKLPIFSDTSHLLTHVGSKGHLSHLHKLQVRSHGELGAAHRLAAYNRWYSDHDLAGMLSERLQQRLSRQGNRAVTNHGAITPTAMVNPAVHFGVNILPQASGHMNLQGANLYDRNVQTTRRDGRRVMQQEMDDAEYDPALFTHASGMSLLASSPLEYLNQYGNFGDDLEQSMSLSPRSASPEYSRLKGQVWPGMDMFDSASLEMARKRNQRKDSTLVKYLLASTKLVEPFEMTFLLNGTLKRKRHLDSLEDDSNLVEGETSMAELMKRRPVLKAKKPRKVTKAPAQAVTTPSPLESNSADDSLIINQYLVTEAGSPSSGLAMDSGGLYPHDGFVFYPGYEPMGAHGTINDGVAHHMAANTMMNPFMGNPQYTPSDNPNFTSPPPWAPVNPYQDQVYDPFFAHQPAHSLASLESQTGPNMVAGNPLHWDHISPLHQGGIIPTTAAGVSVDSLDNDLGALRHVYAYTCTPSGEAVAQVSRGRSTIHLSHASNGTW